MKSLFLLNTQTLPGGFANTTYRISVGEGQKRLSGNGSYWRWKANSLIQTQACFRVRITRRFAARRLPAVLRWIYPGKWGYICTLGDRRCYRVKVIREMSTEKPRD